MKTAMKGHAWYGGGGGEHRQLCVLHEADWLTADAAKITSRDLPQDNTRLAWGATKTRRGQNTPKTRRGRAAMARAPDCLASHACVPGSNPAVPVCGFQRNNIVSPFLMWLGGHVNGGLVELRLRTVYRSYFAQGHALRAPHTHQRHLWRELPLKLASDQNTTKTSLWGGTKTSKRPEHTKTCQWDAAKLESDKNTSNTCLWDATKTRKDQNTPKTCLWDATKTRRDQNIPKTSLVGATKTRKWPEHTRDMSVRCH